MSKVSVLHGGLAREVYAARHGALCSPLRTGDIQLSAFGRAGPWTIGSMLLRARAVDCLLPAVQGQPAGATKRASYAGSSSIIAVKLQHEREPRNGILPMWLNLQVQNKPVGNTEVS